MTWHHALTWKRPARTIDRIAFFTLYASFTTDMSRIFNPDTLIPASPNRTVAVTLAPADRWHARETGDMWRDWQVGRTRTCRLAVWPQQQRAGEAWDLVVCEVADVPVAHHKLALLVHWEGHLADGSGDVHRLDLLGEREDHHNVLDCNTRRRAHTHRPGVLP